MLNNSQTNINKSNVECAYIMFDNGNMSRLKELRKAAGLTQKGLAKLLGVSDQQVSLLERGERRLSTYWMERIAPHLNVQPHEIIIDTGLSETNSNFQYPPNANGLTDNQSLSQHIDINIYDVQVSAGGGQWMQDDAFVIGQLAFRRDWLKKQTRAPIDQLAIIKVNGDSMEPTLSDEDTVLVDMTQKHPVTGNLYIIWDEGALYVKRLQVQGGQVVLISDNPMYAPYTLTSGTTEIVGRVIWQGRNW